MIFSIVSVFIISTNLVESFYLPGIAPTHFCPRSSITDDNAQYCQSEIKIFVNRLNSAESVIPYEYSHFDFCTVKDGESSPAENLGQVVFGERIRPSPYKSRFLEPAQFQEACSKKYLKGDNEAMKKLDKLRNAIKLNYQHHWIIDNMPVTFCYNVDDKKEEVVCFPGFPIGCYVNAQGVGKNGCHQLIVKPVKESFYLFNHVSLVIEYYPKETDWGKNLPDDAARLVKARVELRSLKYAESGNFNTDEPLALPNALSQNFSIIYTYGVVFKKNEEVKWNSRWDFILDSFADAKIQWFSIVNSLAIVLMLSGMVAVILFRNLHRDLARYNKADINLDEEEFGWKLVHGDVFRSPRGGMLLSVFVGSGVQIFFMALITLIFACLGFLSPANRGSLMTCALVLYVCLGTPSGYVSSRIYKMFNGEKWKSNVILTSFLCPGIVFGVFFVLNMVFWGLQSSGAIPFTTLIAILALWFGISVPLTFVGAYFGFKKFAVEFPVKVNQIPRQIPPSSWYLSFPISFVTGGILPFGCICIQLFFILNSIWGHQVYYMFGCLFVVFIILIITCSETAILLCYFQLCSENYAWWWRAFLTSASTSVYFFGYSAHYFFTKMDSVGFVGGILYFGYTFIMSFLLFLFTGTVGFLACFWFVRKIYSAIKVD